MWPPTILYIVQWTLFSWCHLYCESVSMLDRGHNDKHNPDSRLTQLYVNASSL